MIWSFDHGLTHGLTTLVVKLSFSEVLSFKTSSVGGPAAKKLTFV